MQKTEHTGLEEQGLKNQDILAFTHSFPLRRGFKKKRGTVSAPWSPCC